jgi:copper oxidase (laccase) domain-containing protein
MSTLPVLTSALLTEAGVRHAFFTRQGGISTGLYESLNVGRGSADEPEDVAENRRRAAAHFGVGPEALNTCYQIHSADALIAAGPWGETRPEADGVVTATPGIVCGALAAAFLDAGLTLDLTLDFALALAFDLRFERDAMIGRPLMDSGW